MQDNNLATEAIITKLDELQNHLDDLSPLMRKIAGILGHQSLTQYKRATAALYF